MFVCVLPALGLPPRVDWALGAMSVTNLGILVPSTPGFIGPFHFFCAQTIAAQGVSPPVALAYAVLVHLAFYVPATLWGALAMLWYGVQVGETAALARAARRSPGEVRVRGVRVRVIARRELGTITLAPGAFELALTESLLPDAIARESGAVERAAAFLVGQVGALPPELRALYRLGMAAFRIWVGVRRFARFDRLPLDARRAEVESWASGPLATTRRLFRVARANVLLAGFEMPEAAPLLEPAEQRQQAIPTVLRERHRVS
jgi:hypothetical protein